MAGGQRLDVEDVHTGARDTALVQRGEQGVLVDDRRTRGVDQIRRRLQQGELGRAEQPPGAVAEREMHGDEVAVGQQLLLGSGQMDAHLVGVLLGEVLAPRGDPHPEGQPDLGHPAADLAEPQQAEAAPVQIGADRALPRTAGPQRLALLDDPARQPQQQRPRQLDRWGRGTGRTADRDAVRLGGGVVDDRVAHTGRDQQLQPGEPGEE